MSLINVRSATPADVDFIVEANVRMAKETENLDLNPEVLRRGVTYLMSHSDEGQYLIATQGAGLCGTLMLTYEFSDWRNGRFWWIQSVYVPQPFRRQGVYRAMHNAVRKLAHRDSQACGLRLYVEQANSVAQQTYADIGMSQTHYRLFEEIFD